MDAIHAYNRRGTVHKWNQTALPDYLQMGCRNKIATVHVKDLQTGLKNTQGMPHCVRCFGVPTEPKS